LAKLGVIAQDYAPAPAIRFGVRNRGVKDRTLQGFVVELGAGDQRPIRLNRESILGGEPGFVVGPS
jgi:hypothetical protein